MRSYDTENSPLIPGSEEIHVEMHNSKKTRNICLLLIIVLVVLNIIFITSFAFYFQKYLNNKKNEIPEWKKGHVSDSALGSYQYVAVAADSAICTNLGSYVMNILRGNAMDAGVSTVLCAGVTNFHSAGIGGGSFLNYYDRKTKTSYTYDYRETAPKSSDKNMFNSLPRNASTTGGLAIAVPGEILGLYTAHSRHGRVAWKSLVTPIVNLLRNGQRVNKPLADAIAASYDSLSPEPPFAELKNWMVNPDTKKPYVEGDLLIDEKLAKTFEVIADNPFSFYNGSIAADIVKEVSNNGFSDGLVTLEDLAKYTVSIPTPLTVKMESRNLTAAVLPPPSSGAVLAFILNVIDVFKMKADVRNSLDSYVTFLHRIIETFKFAYAKRSALGDKDFVNVTELVRNLTSDSYAQEIRRQISDDKTHDVNYYGPSFDWPEDSGTTHVSLVDGSGNAIAITSTINTYFGSAVKGNVTGILYNNEMDDFSVPNRTNYFGVPPSVSNFIMPGKRPMSSMAPIIVTDNNGDVRFVSGAAGGTRITTAIAYTLVRMFVLGENVKEALDSFRLHHQLVPNKISYNPKVDYIPKEVMDRLSKKGHEWAKSSSISVVEAITSKTNSKGWYANTDFRKPSISSGY